MSQCFKSDGIINSQPHCQHKDVIVFHIRWYNQITTTLSNNDVIVFHIRWYNQITTTLSNNDAIVFHIRWYNQITTTLTNNDAIVFHIRWYNQITTTLSNNDVKVFHIRWYNQITTTLSNNDVIVFHIRWYNQELKVGQDKECLLKYVLVGVTCFQVKSDIPNNYFLFLRDLFHWTLFWNQSVLQKEIGLVRICCQIHIVSCVFLS